MQISLPPLLASTTASIALLAIAQAGDPPPPDTSEFEHMLAGFGDINTIAGRGFADNCNGWIATMEGGLATNAELSRPHMAQADAAGNVFIADKAGHTIRMVKTDGTIHTVAGNGTRGNGGEGVATSIALREPNGLFTFPDGTTYILEIDDNCNTGAFIPGGKIRRLGTDGMLTTILEDPALGGGRGILVSADESTIFYSSYNVVKKFTEAGGIEIFASGFPPGNGRGIANLDIDPITGLICVADRGSSAVYRLSADGSTRTIIAGNAGTSGGGHGELATETGLDQLRGVAFQPDGSFFLCTHKGDEAIWFVDTSGLIWKLTDGFGHSGDGQPLSSSPRARVSEPRAVALAPNGDLLITEHDNGFIRRVTNICINAEITQFSLLPGQATLTFRSHREGQYIVEQSSDLVRWDTTLDVDTGNGPSTTVSVGPDDLRDFFRVRDSSP